MAEVIYDKYIVIKNDDILKYLSGAEERILDVLLEKINTHRLTSGKVINDYWVVNQDEPYAGKVLNLILAEEDTKNA